MTLGPGYRCNFLSVVNTNSCFLAFSICRNEMGKIDLLSRLTELPIFLVMLRLGKQKKCFGKNIFDLSLSLSLSHALWSPFLFSFFGILKICSFLSLFLIYFRFALGRDQTQCDQVGRFIALWATFQSLQQQLFCPNHPHFLTNFVKL